MEDIIIIGAGPVGLYAGTLAALHNLKGIIFESLPNVGGQLTSLYPEKAIIDLPGFKSILAKDYIDELYAQQQSVNNPLPVHLNEKVISYEKEEDYFVVNTSLSTYKTKTILICSGMGSFEPRKAGLENEDKLNNVIYSITEKEKYRNKNIAILGGGDSAIDWAITLKDIAKEVYIVHRRDEFRGQSSSVNLMIEKGVKVYKPYLVKSFNGIVVSSNFSIPLDVSYNTDYSYGLLGNETKQVWVMTSPANIPMVVIGSASTLLGMILMPTGFGNDMNGLGWTGLGLFFGGMIVGFLSFAFPQGYYETVEVVNNDGFKSEIYLASNIATTSVGYKMSFK